MKTRIFLGLVILSLLNSCNSDSKSDKIRFFIGTYSQSSDEGIFYAEFDWKNSKLEIINSTTGISNPSFLSIDPKGNFLYSVSEVNDFNEESSGGIFAFKINQKDGALTKIDSIESGGAHPCHLSIHPSGNFLYVANYSGGNISSAQISSSGGFLPGIKTMQHLGSGPDKSRQEKAHAHSANLSSDGNFLYACDLGIDQVVAYSINPSNGQLKPSEPASLSISPGSGPRHMAIDNERKIAFVINELNSSITSCRINLETGALTAMNTTTTLPEGFQGENYCADIHIHPDKNLVYASNRGHNSIAVFKFDTKDGSLILLQHHSTLGDWPRNFAIDPSGLFLFVANQKSDNVVVLKLDQNSGLLSETGMAISINQPVCVVFHL